MLEKKLATTIIDASYNSSKNKFRAKHKGKPIKLKSTKRLNFEIRDVVNKEDYEFEFDRYKDLSFYSKPTEIADPLQTIRASLNYIEMSPNNKGEQLKSYILAEEGDMKSTEELDKMFGFTREIYINENKQVLEYTYNKWLIKAIGLLSTHNTKLSSTEQQEARNLTKYIIHGPPGIGKTALINYIFSVNAKELIKNKIIWIRVNLNNVEKPNLTLRDRLNSKFLRIFCRFYFLNKNYPEFDKRFQTDIHTQLQKHINTSKKFKLLSTCQERIDLAGRYMQMLLTLTEETSEEFDNIIYPSHHQIDSIYANHLTEELITYIQKQVQYSYIFIFDGLDSATIDFIDYKIYDSWLDEIKYVINNSDKRYRGVYIITMRDYSAIKFGGRFKREKASLEDRIDYRIMKVKQQKSSEIFKRKLLIAKERLGNSFNLELKNLMNLRINLYNLIYMCMNDLKYTEILSMSSFDSIDEEVNNLFCDNYRALMRFLRQLILVVYTFLKERSIAILTGDPKKGELLQEFSAKTWVINRLLLYGDIGEDVYHNRISYNLNEEPYIVTNNRAVVSNIFNFNDKAKSLERGILPKNLVKMRIIQYLKKNDSAGIKDAIDWACKNIDQNWTPEELRYETREMIYNNIIYPVVNYYTFAKAEETGRNYQVVVNKSFDVIESMIGKSIYYETVIDDTPIDRNFSENMEPLNRLDSRFEFDDYLMRKYRSVFFFIEYLLRIEKNEKKLLINNFNISEESYLNDFIIFSKNKIERIKRSMANSLAGRLRSIPKTRYRNFIDDWYDFFDVPKQSRIYN